ncbi:Protein ALP1-like [Eumeta japonica]|uniref:Protein ALP1-like n=1 Tax=Eumeta variegata TaxID=151549 RepID=A0A4C1WVA7_EUMVA|nr:Protein ALP1-like [Eumeta japonica]
MPQPSEDHLKNVSLDFEEMWNFPNCIGSLDGKHCRVKRPRKSGSAYYNYKHYFSIVLQAVADAKKRFITIEVGGRGKQSDGGTFNASSLNRLLERGAFNIPEPRTLPNSNITAPYVIVADEAYPLKEYLMRPYPQRTLNQERENFNNRLSRARKTVECAFGILCNKWRVLLKPIETDVKHGRLIIKTACLLHNIVIDIDGHDSNCNSENRTTQTRHRRQTGRNNNPSNRAKQVRNQFTKYFWENNRLIFT